MHKRYDLDVSIMNKNYRRHFDNIELSALQTNHINGLGESFLLLVYDYHRIGRHI